METLLKTEIDKFREWANRYPIAERSGEWECDYFHWTEIYAAFGCYLKSLNPIELSENSVVDLIYIIARDNELEELISLVSEEREWLSALLPHVLISSEHCAQWQFAKALGKNILQFHVSENALLELVKSPDEYVSRLALQSLGTIGSSHAEEFCEMAWKSGHEYQRIMALWVLKEIGSPKIVKYIAAAKKDGREYILQNVQEIEKA